MQTLLLLVPVLSTAVRDSCWPVQCFTNCAQGDCCSQIRGCGRTPPSQAIRRPESFGSRPSQLVWPLISSPKHHKRGNGNHYRNGPNRSVRVHPKLSCVVLRASALRREFATRPSMEVNSPLTASRRDSLAASSRFALRREFELSNRYARSSIGVNHRSESPLRSLLQIAFGAPAITRHITAVAGEAVLWRGGAKADRLQAGGDSGSSLRAGQLPRGFTAHWRSASP